MERVTAESHRAKDLKKMEAGRAGAVARKAKQKRLLQDLGAEFERSECVVRAQKNNVVQREVIWTPWILEASWLAGLFLFKHFTIQLTHAGATQQAGAQKKQAVSKTTDVNAKQLNVDPFYIE